MKYTDYLKQISADDLIKGLVAYGLFSEKIPPFLSSEKFFDYMISRPNQNDINENCSDYITFEAIRNINIPRKLSIPSPLIYYKLCNLLKDNWEYLIKYFETKTSSQKFKISRIHIRKNKKNKSIFNMTYNNYNIDDNALDDILVGKNFQVKTDISACFPSIYSHSISWALVGKKEAKKNKNKHNKIYNKIDHLTSALSNNQTHGLLIGPHSSNLLSEIILTNIDNSMVSRGYEFIRNIDDYECYVNTYEEGESFLLDLSRELRVYGLELNKKKTSIIKQPIAMQENWVSIIKSFDLYSNYSKVKYSDLKTFLCRVLKLMNDNNENSAVLGYAIKSISKAKLTENAINYYMKMIRHLTLLYPYLITYIENYVFKPFNINKKQISLMSSEICKLAIKRDYYQLLSFALYYSLKYDFKFNFNEQTDILYKYILESEDCINLLLGYLYYKKIDKKNIMQLFITKALELKNNDRFGEYWVFIYEVLDKDNFINTWKELKKNKISFINL